MARHILTQREQWPFRIEAVGFNLPALPKMPTPTPILPTPDKPQGTVLPAGQTADTNAASNPTKTAPKPVPRPQKPFHPGASAADIPADLPSVEAAGITNVDYSHLPFGEPQNLPDKSQGGGTSGGGAAGGAAAGGAAGSGAATPGSYGGGAGGPAPSGGSTAEQMKPRIMKDLQPQFQQHHITDPAVQQKWVDAIAQQGITESGWRDVPQAINDVNSQKGTPAQSYLQYVPSTFDRAMDLAGVPKEQRNLHDLDQNISGVLPLEFSEGLVDEHGNPTGIGHGTGWG
jgi:hypothetical protein